MTARGNDCCGTCEFNAIQTLKVAQADAEDAFLCRIRRLAIASPFWTYCHNHQRRNPLLIREPRGPLWGAVLHPARDLPLSARVLSIPELIPPRETPGEWRLPFCGDQRPLDSDAGTCEACGSAVENAVAVTYAGNRVCFCSVAHYLDWWLEHAPEAAAYRERQLVSEDDLQENLIALVDELAEMDTQPPSRLDVRRMLDLLQGLEGIIAQTLHGYPDLARAEAASPKDGVPPHLLLVLSRMAEIGELRQAELVDLRALHRRLRQIRNLLESYLAGAPVPGPGSAASERRRARR